MGVVMKDAADFVDKNIEDAEECSEEGGSADGVGAEGGQHRFIVGFRERLF